MTIRLFAIDIYGTLLNEKKQIPPANRVVIGENWCGNHLLEMN
ncbi:hypothetical protein [Vagococcus allomyrinae]|nr:hypothetical protein [Vagococcus allomyrinae]